MESFSDEQMARFEAWSRSGFNKNNVRKVFISQSTRIFYSIMLIPVIVG